MFKEIWRSWKEYRMTKSKLEAAEEIVRTLPEKQRRILANRLFLEYLVFNGFEGTLAAVLHHATNQFKAEFEVRNMSSITRSAIILLNLMRLGRQLEEVFGQTDMAGEINRLTALLDDPEVQQFYSIIANFDGVPEDGDEWAEFISDQTH